MQRSVAGFYVTFHSSASAHAEQIRGIDMSNPKDTDAGHVYFLVSNNFKKVKIGFTADLYARMANFKTASPDEMHLWDALPCFRSDEEAMHHRFAHKHIEREWFKFDDEMADFLEDLEFARRDILLDRFNAGAFRPKTEEEIAEALDAIPLADLLPEVCRPSA